MLSLKQPMAPQHVYSNIAKGSGMEQQITFHIAGLNFYYGKKQALFNVSLDIRARQVTALIGPSGCGKSTFLRTLNRMNDVIGDTHTDGCVELDGQDIFARDVDVVALRRRVGMVFQRPTPFQMSIFDNIAYGPRMNGLASRADLPELVEKRPAAGRVVGRGKRRAAASGHVTLRRAAATPVHRARAGGTTGSTFDGRAVLRPRSHLHRAHRGVDDGFEGTLHYRHRHA